MSDSLSKYLVAVAKRKAYKTPGERLNWAILQQLHDDDIPRLTEISNRLSDCVASIKAFAEGHEGVPYMEEIEEIALSGMIKVAELAEHGSSARWGDVRGDA